MANAVQSPFLCKWRSEAIPHFEVQIADNPTGTKRYAYLINTRTNGVIYTTELTLTAVFDRCVWKANDLPRDAPLESRLFRGFGKRACWVGFDADNLSLHIMPYTSFDDTRLKNHTLVYNPEVESPVFVEIEPEREEPYDPQAEKGMIRPNRGGEEETVHIWDHVGENGAADVKLIHTRKALGNPRDDLILRIFYRATGRETPIRLENTDDALIGAQLSIEERLTNFALHPIAMLSERRGASYGCVTLSSMQDVPTPYQSFCEGRNLQAADLGEIAAYVRDNLLVVKSPNGQVIAAMKQRARVKVTRERNYDFGGEHGSHDAIHIHMSQNFVQQWLLLPFKAIAAFFSGIFNKEAPKIHQLKDLDEQGMQDLLEESGGLVAFDDDRKKEIFQHFDRALQAGANIDFYIAENRSTARFRVAGNVLAIRSTATAIGRGLSLRWLWEKQEPNPGDGEPALGLVGAEAANMLMGSPVRIVLPQSEQKST